MRTNFKSWLNEEADYNSWLQQNMGLDMADFAKIGGPFFLPSNALQKDGDDNGEPTEKLPNLTPYDVYVNKQGTVYKLVDASEADPADRTKSKTTYGNVTHHGGQEYFLTKDQYQKLALYPKQAQPPGGGMGGPPGGPPPMM